MTSHGVQVPFNTHCRTGLGPITLYIVHILIQKHARALDLFVERQLQILFLAVIVNKSPVTAFISNDSKTWQKYVTCGQATQLHS